jgi:diguanylate cyclase (GGDEF)-like protein
VTPEISATAGTPEDDRSQRDEAGGRRDEVADDRDRASDERDQVAERRDRAADVRGTAGDQRDRAGELRDKAAESRDRLGHARDETAETLDPARTPELAAARRARSAAARREAATDRVHASRDRLKAASERTSGERDRDSSLADRGRSAGDRDAAEIDRTAAQRDRSAARWDREQASFDELTGAYLRGPGLTELHRELSRARRAEQPLVVAFIDVDHLKEVNDSHGHAAGDRLLAAVAAGLRSHLRSYDLIIRFGGDEFVCVLPGLVLTDAATRLEFLNDALAKGPERGSVTIGLAELHAEDSFEGLIARADEALYEQRNLRRGVEVRSPCATTAPSSKAPGRRRVDVDRARGDGPR